MCGVYTFKLLAIDQGVCGAGERNNINGTLKPSQTPATAQLFSCVTAVYITVYNYIVLLFYEFVPPLFRTILNYNYFSQCLSGLQVFLVYV